MRKCSLAFLMLVLSLSVFGWQSPIGCFDAIDNNNFVAQGWTYDPDNSSASVTVHFYLDGPTGTGTLIGSTVANVYRSDVGNHGFSWTIPNQYWGASHNIYAYAIDLTSNSINPLLSGSPKSISNRSPSGAFDSISSSFICTGWAKDPDTSSAIAVHFYANAPAGQSGSTLIGNTTANIYRSDVGNHGYSWTIPVAYRTANRTIYSYAIDSTGGVNPLLTGSPKTVVLPENTLPRGAFDGCSYAYAGLTGWAIDDDSPSQQVCVEFYANDNTLGERLIGSTIANQNRADVGLHGFIWEIPKNIVDSIKSNNSYIRARAVDVNTLQLKTLGSLAVGAVSGNASISGAFGGSSIVITTTSRVAGAIHSLTWNGVEFVNSDDHGRQIQSAASFGVNPSTENEAYNPTEAGSAADGAGQTSTSVLRYKYVSGNYLETKSQMAFWLAPETMCTSCSPDIPTINTTYTSNHVLNKKVTIGAEGLPNVIKYDVSFTLPNDETHNQCQFEMLTAYMPLNFNKYFYMDFSTGNLVQTGDNASNYNAENNMYHENSNFPFILSTNDELHALAIYRIGAGTGRYHFVNTCMKLTMATRVTAPVSGATYTFPCYIIVGTLADVQASLMALGSKAILITSPSSSSQWIKGSTYNITWAKQGTMNGFVKIRLFDSVTNAQINITDNTENDGNYEWVVPADLATGSYYMRVKTVDNLYFDNSDSFQILD